MWDQAQMDAAMSVHIRDTHGSRRSSQDMPEWGSTMWRTEEWRHTPCAVQRYSWYPQPKTRIDVRLRRESMAG